MEFRLPQPLPGEMASFLFAQRAPGTETLTNCEMPLVEGGFGDDPVVRESLVDAEAFLLELRHASVDGWRKTLQEQPQNIQEGLRYQTPPNTLLTLLFPGAVRKYVSAIDRPLVFEGLVRYFQADPSYFIPDGSSGDDTLADIYIGTWLDNIFHQSVPRWFEDRNEAWNCFCYALEMMKGTGLYEKIYPLLPEEIKQNYSDSGLMPLLELNNQQAVSSEVIGFMQDILSSPVLDGENALRFAIALEIHLFEKMAYTVVGVYHGHGLIWKKYSDGEELKSAVFEALLRAGMSREDIINAIDGLRDRINHKYIMEKISAPPACDAYEFGGD